MRVQRVVPAAATFLLWASVADANLLTNGSFESPGGGCASATTSLPGWTVTGNIDIDNAMAHCSTITAADGSYFVDLTGSYSAGSISQTFATTVGQGYLLNFYFGGNPQWQYFGYGSMYGNDGPVKAMTASIDGSVVGNYSLNTTGLAFNQAGWALQSVLFTAAASSTTVRFSSLNTSGVFGPFLDGVSVVARVPEPGTLALFGLGLAGLALTRRRQAA